MKQKEIPKVPRGCPSMNVPPWLQKEGWEESVVEIISTGQTHFRTRIQRAGKIISKSF